MEATTMHEIEFFCDCSSPWTYLAFESIQPIAARGDVTLIWKPFLVGGVFNTVNPSVYENRTNPVPSKAQYYQKDLQDWATLIGIKIGSPPVFPVNSVKVMRGALVALEEGKFIEYTRFAFQRYWGELVDISQDEEVKNIAATTGLDVDEFFEKINDQGYKDQLRELTDELVQRGGFGSPTMFLDGDDMYFGNDRIQLLVAKLDR